MTDKKKPKKTHPWRGFNPKSLQRPTQEGAEDRAVPARHNPLRRNK
jgi:hypothetical protein